MRQALQVAWLGRGWLARLLWPLSQLHGAILRVRRAAFARGLARATRLPVPVVVVGNVVAGGAGKTPLVLALLAHLEGRQLRAGVVSRGYGRRSTDCRAVQPGDAASEVGDEPLLVRRQSGRPVYVAPRRAEAGLALLAAHPDTQLLLCDDGLQHLALARDLELCVFDARGVGNGWLLPAGPLREPWPRPVDLVLCHGEPPGVTGYRMTRRLATHAVRADGMRRPLAEFADRPVHALAGIAQPERFFDMLRERGLSLERTYALPDHHAFETAIPGLGSIDVLLCTEKDAVKLWRLHPQAWAVPLALEIEPAFWAAFDRLLDARLSSADGSQTA